MMINFVDFFIEEPLKAGDSIVVDASSFGLRKREIGTVLRVYPEKGTVKAIFEQGQVGVFIEEDIENLEALFKQQPQEILAKIAQSICWCEMLKNENLKCPVCKIKEQSNQPV